MKKVLLIVLTLSGFCSLAQKSSVKLQVGYGIPLAGSTLPFQSYNGNQNSYSNVTGSLGSGFTVEAGYTYSIAPLISAQMDFTYLSGSETKVSYSEPIAQSNESFSGSFVQVAPLVRFDVGDGKIHPYIAIGPAFSFGSMTNKYYENNDGGTLEQEKKYDGSTGIGTKSILGLELTKGNLGFFVQATMINMSYAPTKSEITKYVYNGQDELSSMTTYNKIIEFKDSIDPNAPYDPNQPKQELKSYYPLSSLALSIGARLKF